MSELKTQLRLIPVKGRQATEELKAYITERHYLKGTPPEAIVKMWVLLNERRIGALMFGRPTNRHWAELPILELTRCVFEDDTPPNVESRSLSVARKYIRTWMPLSVWCWPTQVPARGMTGQSTQLTAGVSSV